MSTYSIRGMLFEGQWGLKDSEDILFDKYELQKGKIRLEVLQYDYENGYYLKEQRMSIIVYDGLHSDGHQAIMNLEIQSAKIQDFGEISVQFEELDSSLKLLYQFQNIKDGICPLNLSLAFKTSQIQNNTGIFTIPQFNAQISSEKCSLNLEAKLKVVDLDKQANKAVQYLIFVTSVAITHFLVIVKMMKNLMNNEHDNTRYSLITLIWFFCWDGYFAILHLVSPVFIFQLFSAPAFIYLILWLIFERSIIMYIWRCRNQGLVQQVDNYRKQFIKFHFLMYFGSIAALTLIIYNIHHDWFLILTNLYFVPQIIHNIIKGHQTINDWDYIFGLGCFRSIIPGCPFNALEVQQNYYICILIIATVLFQVLIMKHQQFYGPRFLVPTIFLPKRYNYFIEMEEQKEQDITQSGTQTEECIICFSPLNDESDLEVSTGKENESYQIQQLKQKKNKIMKTPCNHQFHIKCLLSWMNIKMECPTCRAQLPPID